MIYGNEVVCLRDSYSKRRCVVPYVSQDDSTSFYTEQYTLAICFTVFSVLTAKPGEPTP